ncbi:MAG: cytochrome P460 family protein [Nitrospira sp.]|nr:cytochrome P460 family protein [Nitrospira sp.]
MQKPDAVRDLYINPIAAKAERGQPFAKGSVLVMAIYNARKNTEETFEKGTDGNLVKGELAKVFVMQKGPEWGKGAPENLENGDWIYSAFKPNGERLDVNYTPCRSCHLPLGESKDYVHRYDEYFEKRMH